MEQELLFIGIDVDDQAYHTHLVSKQGTEFNFVCRPNAGVLIEKLKGYKDRGFELKICYEATYIGFSLQRKLKAAGLECEAIAPSLIPREPGRQVKTDRIDARKLARYYMQGMLTSIQVPDEEEETVRDLLRSREFVSKKLSSIKVHILSVCRRYSLNFREEVGKPGAHYWTQPHFQWLESKISKIQYPSLKMNLSTLLMIVRQLESQIDTYDEMIAELSNRDRYKKPVKALCCFRGISTRTAMVLINEIGDISRFNHPKRLTSFSGMDIIEKSSGGTEKKFNITHMGNKYIRTAVVEACQTALKPPRISSDLKRRREGAEPRSVEIADRCMQRLNKKGTRLLFAGKQKNKVTVACGREMLGFIWETLRAS